MTKKTKTPTFKSYPEPVTTRSGCKVSWNYYKTEEEARACSKAAGWNRDIKAGLGYDFGYCWPGTVKRMTDAAPYGEAQYAELWEVCLP